MFANYNSFHGLRFKVEITRRFPDSNTSQLLTYIKKTRNLVIVINALNHWKRYSIVKKLESKVFGTFTQIKNLKNKPGQ